jgi:hypothetical protein
MRGGGCLANGGAALNNGRNACTARNTRQFGVIAWLDRALQ